MPFAAKGRVLAALLLAVGAQAGGQVECRRCHSSDSPSRSDPALSPCPRAGRPGSQALAESPAMLHFGGGEGRYGRIRFAHRAHAEMAAMGDGCAACHHHGRSRPVQRCAECHSKERLREDTSLPDLAAARHRLCIDCHRQWGAAAAGCASCHDAAEKTPPVGWLNHRFHSGLGCGACHQTPGQFRKKKIFCVSCHEKWPKGFEHARTGLVLDETHRAFECENCHAGKGYSAKPACAGCHDDRGYPKDVPGRRVRN